MNKIHSLYIHIPFCEHICDYCDFPKLQYFPIFSKKYLARLEEELHSYNIKNLDTIYIGGGTPTSLSDEEFELLLNFLKPYSNGVIEYTIEANPESLSLNKIKLLKKFGVNRVSIGVESTNDKILKSINRHHTFNDVKIAISRLNSAGIDNISVDLILGLPNVSKIILSKDLDNVLSLNIKHLSCYSLTVHKHTKFGIQGITPPSDDVLRDFYDLVEEKTKSKGFIHYEVSNYCLLGYESKHNMTYWKDEEYYGIGMGASGYVEGIRYTNTKSINDYLNEKFVSEKENITLDDDITYFIMLNLRTIHGLSFIDFSKRFKYDLFKAKKNEILELIKENYLIINNDRLIPTYNGMMILDQIILKLI